jgi:hypothetical protein
LEQIKTEVKKAIESISNISNGNNQYKKSLQNECDALRKAMEAFLEAQVISVFIFFIHFNLINELFVITKIQRTMKLIQIKNHF